MANAEGGLNSSKVMVEAKRAATALASGTSMLLMVVKVGRQDAASAAAMSASFVMRDWASRMAWSGICFPNGTQIFDMRSMLRS
eukprot:9372590-Heterocapsa_arctica.AAC.1